MLMSPVRSRRGHKSDKNQIFGKPFKAAMPLRPSDRGSKAQDACFQSDVSSMARSHLDTRFDAQVLGNAFHDQAQVAFGELLQT